MSANPQAMMQMLASGLGGQQQGQNPQAQVSPLGAGAQLAQKIMLMKMLQGQPQQPQPPAALPGAPQPQQPNALPMPGGVNA